MTREEAIEEVEMAFAEWEHEFYVSGDDWSKEHEALDMAVKALGGKDTNVPTKWISVKDRLPEDRRAVLVTAYWHETYQVMMGSYYGDGLWWCVPFNNTGEHEQKLKPKAWMELLEPYTESVVQAIAERL